MDREIKKLDHKHGWAENVLCAKGDLEDAIGLQKVPKYYPITMRHGPEGNFRQVSIGNAGAIYKSDDLEYCCINRFFSNEGRNCRLFDDRSSSFPIHYPLDLCNTPEDVRFRQQAVKELVGNENLFKFFGSVLTDCELYSWDGYDAHSTTFRSDAAPEKFYRLFERLMLLDELHPKSESINRIHKWALEMSQDDLFRELFVKKRKVTDSRLFAVFSERFNGVRYGILKPGVSPENVFDFIDKEISEHDVFKKSGRRKKIVTRSIVGYETPIDGSVIKLSVGHAKQKMDVLNEMCGQILAIPALLMYAQMKHLYQGAYFHRLLESKGYDMVFPEIDDNPRILELKDVFPIRMLLNHFRPSYDRIQYAKEYFVTNSFSFGDNDKIIQIEGPNRRGKSEAWRTLHLAAIKTNSGYSLPAKSAIMGVVPSSHFISCKGDSGNGGSELERSLNGIFRALEHVKPNGTVILDEFGDATNAPTSVEIAKRLLPLLLENGNRILLTTHHDALSEMISEELHGVSFMPDPQSDKKYNLVKSERPIDFKANEVLDDMQLTPERIKGALSGTPKSKFEKVIQEINDSDNRGIDDEKEEDIPF